MAFEPLSETGRDADKVPLAKRLGWMLAIWVMGVAVVGTVGFIIRLWIKS